MGRQQQMVAGWLLSVVAVCAGCGSGGAGHTDDKTPGGTPTPPMDALMDQKAFSEYSKKAAAETKKGDPNRKLGLPTPP